VRWLGGVLKVLGEQEGTKFLENLAKSQHPRAQNLSGSAMMGLISTGEVGIGPAFTSHAAQSVEKGAPVEWLPIPPIVANQGVEVVFKKAPHPNAAMLFIDYMLGPESSAVWKAKKYNTPSDKVDFEAWSPEGEAGSLEAYNANFTKWQDLFNEIFG
jgi:iron(III) transport system substrate-binding protein